MLLPSQRPRRRKSFSGRRVGSSEHAEYHFYAALAHAASLHRGAGRRARPLIETPSRRTTGNWRSGPNTAPRTSQHRAALVAAEIARIEGRDLEAMRLYEQAIRSAHDNGFVHHEALANELAGRFYLGRGLDTNGVAHLRNARACYARWGADGKVKQLDRQYPQLVESRTPRAHAPPSRCGPSSSTSTR